MRFTLSWLKNFLQTTKTAEEIIEGLNKIGLEVEEVVNQYETYKAFIIAEILSATPHPEADKLRVCQVNNGKEILQIVCGAPNARAGIKVVLAPIGTVIPSNSLKIKQSKIRNVDSCGMMCSYSELSLGEDHNGIIELDEHYKVGDSFAKTHGLDDVIIEVSITPNRGDCLGVYGIARDLAAAGFGNLKELNLAPIAGNFKSPINVEIKTDNCPKYIGRYFNNIINGDSPLWIQKLLKSVGQKPISALVDITNYFTLTYGRPMHVFDADLISNIEVRNAKNGEEFEALNDKTYQLNEGDLVLSSKDKVIGLAGIIGEKQSEVSRNTKNIFLEIGIFDQNSVIKAARAHQIDTDAKYRFERKVDREFMETSLHLATSMIIEICKGTPSESIIIEKGKFTPIELNFPLSMLKKKLGIDYEKTRVIEILKALGFNVKDLVDSLNLTVPSWRHDISICEDIVEEIARIDGYDKIASEKLPDIGFATLDSKQRNLYRISRYTASLGLNEVVTWSFMNSKKAALFDNLKDELYIKNPISSELDYVRNSIIPNLLDVLEKNQNRGINNLKIFELASCFKGIQPEQQIPTLAGLRSGFNHQKNHYNDQREVDVFDVKADIFNIINELGFDPYKLQYDVKNLPKYYHPGRASALVIGKNIIGYFGQVHPQILNSYGIKHNVVIFELFIDDIPTPKPKHGRKGNIIISDFQEVGRDFAFIIDRKIEIDSIVKSISQIDKKLIRSVNLFDIYMGKNIDEDKKSIAFNVKIQADDRTLTDSEIEVLSNKIIETTIAKTNGILRSA